MIILFIILFYKILLGFYVLRNTTNLAIEQEAKIFTNKSTCNMAKFQLKFIQNLGNKQQAINLLPLNQFDRNIIINNPDITALSLDFLCSHEVLMLPSASPKGFILQLSAASSSVLSLLLISLPCLFLSTNNVSSFFVLTSSLIYSIASPNTDALSICITPNLHINYINS